MSGRHDIQGNILRGYASHKHAAYLLVRIDERDRARALLLRLLQDDRIAREHDWVQWPRSRVNVAFTHRGLERLGVSLDAFTSFDAFGEGMHARARAHLGDLGGNDPDNWAPTLATDADALFTVYADGPVARNDEAASLADELGIGGMTVIHDQRADMLEGAREHFGFADGFSQPALSGVSEDRRARRGEGVQRSRWPLVAEQWRDLALGEFVLGHRDEDGVVPGEGEPLLVNGSFMVWRMLEQHVEVFDEWVREQASGDPGAQDRLKAQILGRWPDGVSLMRRRASYDGGDQPDGEGAVHDLRINDFTYGDDPDGVRCPLGAHVRRSNPRDALGFRTERTRRNRIIRRGMPYRDDSAEPPSRGLVFVCFNASITRQFEQVQGNWLMGGDTFGLGVQRDFLTAGVDAEQPTIRMTIQGDRANPPSFITRDRQFVTVRGGYYLFVPGLEALRRMVEG